MNQNLIFYQTEEDEDSLYRSIAPLLLKILEEKKKVLIFCDSDQIKRIDSFLWSYGRNKFIPHATILDQEFNDKNDGFKRQPILISDQENNANVADYLIFVKPTSNSFVLEFQRSFYFFSGNNFTEAKTLISKLKPGNFYKKDEGKWVKKTGLM